MEINFNILPDDGSDVKAIPPVVNRNGSFRIWNQDILIPSRLLDYRSVMYQELLM